MPGVSGVEIYSKSNDHSGTYHLPCIFLLSRYSDNDLAIKIITNGAVDFLNEPILTSRLVNVLSTKCQVKGRK